MGFHQHQKESPCNQNKFMDGANGAGQKPSRIAVVDGSDSPQTRWMAFASPIHYSPHGSAAGSPPGRTLLLDKSSFCGGNSTKATSGINGAGRSFRQHHYHPQTGVASWRVASMKWEHLGNLTDIESPKLGRSWIFIEQGANHERKLDFQITRLEFHLLHNESICKVLGHLYTLWE